jgi:hypothetical protein
LLTTGVCVATIPGFFDRPQRELFIVAGLVALIWWRDLPVPRTIVRPIGVLGAASMWIYLTHFSIWPPVAKEFPPLVAYAITVTAGVIVWAAVTYAPRLLPSHSTGLARWRTTHRSLASPNASRFGQTAPSAPSGAHQ